MATETSDTNDGLHLAAVFPNSSVTMYSSAPKPVNHNMSTPIVKKTTTQAGVLVAQSAADADEECYEWKMRSWTIGKVGYKIHLYKLFGNCL